MGDTDLRRQLDDWQSRGLLDAATADRLRADLARPAPSTPGGPSLLTEALGYVGGVLVLGGALALVAQVWDDLGRTGEQVVVGLGALALVTAGAAVPDRLGGAARRLRALLWLLSTGAVMLLLGLTLDRLDADQSDGFASWLLGLSGLWALALWRARPHLLQQLAVVGLGAGTAASLAADLLDSDQAPGAAAWFTGAAWLAAGVSGRVAGRPGAVLGGAVVTTVASLATTGDDTGHVLTLATAAGLLVLAVRDEDPALLAVGAICLLVSLPLAAAAFFPGVIAVPLALVASGVLVLTAALRLR